MQQRVDISTGQIGSPDAAGEKNIAADEQVIFARKKAKTAGAMSRNFEHLHFQSEKFSCGRLFNKKICFNRLYFELKSEAAKEFRIGNHWRGLGVAADLAIETPFDFAHIRDVIEMAMGEQQQL